MLAGIGAALQIILLILKWLFTLDNEKRKKLVGLKGEIKNVKTTSDISKLFDDINRM